MSARVIEWIRRLIFAGNEKLGDLIESRGWPDRVWDWYPTNLLQRMVCAVVGHVPSPDQCNIPEHDLCAWCSTSTPCEAPR